MYTVSEKVQFIQGVFGTGIISRSGDNIAVSCPGCDPEKKKKKFSINLETDQNHCWSCEIKGKNLYWTLGKFFSKNVQEKYNKKFLGGECSYSFSEDEEDEEEQLNLDSGFVLLAQNLKSKDPDVQSAISYCKKRGMTNKCLWYFKVGTCKKGRFRRKVIFPSFDSCGNLNYFVARAIDNKQYRKYINSDVKKTEIIFNEINIDWTKPLTIVEGVFDLIKCNKNSIPILGSDLSTRSSIFSYIVKNQTPVILALDSDMDLKTQKISKLLSSYGIDVKILNLEGFSDVGEMTKKEFSRAYRESKQWNPADRLNILISAIKSGSLL